MCLCGCFCGFVCEFVSEAKFSCVYVVCLCVIGENLCWRFVCVHTYEIMCVSAYNNEYRCVLHIPGSLPSFSSELRRQLISGELAKVHVLVET